MANKEDVVTRIARKSGHTKKATYEFMKAFGEVLTETLAGEERFHIHKVITFSPEYKEACVRHNPKTLEEVVIPPHIKVKTVIGSKLERALFDVEDSRED